MKKFFSFSGTISGKTFLLRTLFVLVMCIPILIATISKWTSYFISLSGFDISDPSIENQMEIQKFGDELALKIAENPDFYISDFINSFSFFWILIFLTCIVPVIWFGFANYYKRISALFYEQRNNVFFAVIAFDVISDILILKYDTGSFFLTVISPLIFVYLIASNSKIDTHEG